MKVEAEWRGEGGSVWAGGDGDEQGEKGEVRMLKNIQAGDREGGSAAGQCRHVDDDDDGDGAQFVYLTSIFTVDLYGGVGRLCAKSGAVSAFCALGVSQSECSFLNKIIALSTCL